MPRQPKIPKYSLFKPRGLAKVRIGDVTHYLGPHGSKESREKYDRLIAEWLTTRSSPAPLLPPISLTVADIVEAYYDHAARYYCDQAGDRSLEVENLGDALRPVRALYGSALAREFGPLALETVRDEMIRSGLARSTINARVHRIRRCFRWATSKEMIPPSVIQALGTVGSLAKNRTEAREPEPVVPVPIATLEATLPHLSATVAAMVKVHLLTGARASEITVMRGMDLKAVGDVWEYRPGAHKGIWLDLKRVIVLGPQAVAIVKAFLRPDLSAYLFDPREAVAAHHGARTASRKSKPTPSEIRKRSKLPGAARCPRYDRRTYRQAIVRACKKAFPHPTLNPSRGKRLTPEQRDELKRWHKDHAWSPLQLRHTAATLVRAKYGLEAAQVILGHAKADVTQLYAEKNLTQARTIMAEMG